MNGAPGAIPTRDLPLRRRTLYAAELREHIQNQRFTNTWSDYSVIIPLFLPLFHFYSFRILNQKLGDDKHRLLLELLWYVATLFADYFALRSLTPHPVHNN